MYIEYVGGKTPEIYNVANDPRQERNLINTDEGLRALPELKKALEDLKKGKKL